uniref:Uncharacterized protein n=1 Tax=Anguilla anguilla TaxID=7936 RepID=A0A0E9P6K1_ANGAN
MCRSCPGTCCPQIFLLEKHRQT